MVAGLFQAQKTRTECVVKRGSMIVNMTLFDVDLKIYAGSVVRKDLPPKWVVTEVTAASNNIYPLLRLQHCHIQRAVEEAAKEKACHDGELVI
jgi:serine acetyltransferase